MILITVLLQINMYRHSLGLPKVFPASTLCTYADQRAKHISIDFSHTGFFQKRPYQGMVENLARNFNTNDVVNAWIHSPLHNANLINPDVHHLCVVREDINGNSYYAMEGTY